MNRETLKKIDRFLTFGDIKPKVDEADCYYITDQAMQKVIDGFSKELLELHRIITMNQLIEVRKRAGQVEPEVKVQIAKPTYKEIETYIDEYIDMGGFTKPEQAKPYLMDGFEKGYNYLKDKLSNLSA